jgi:hypothetical protein
MDEHFTDLLIRIGPWSVSAGAYPVEAATDDGAAFQGGHLRLDWDQLRALDLDAAAYGMELFYALCDGPIRRAYDKATGRAEAASEGRLRVRLWIDPEAAELHAVPWERLYHTSRGVETALASSALTSFSRYSGLEIPEPAPYRQCPFRLLAAIANPSGLDRFSLGPIAVEEEVRSLMSALLGALRRGQVEAAVLPGRSGLPGALRQELAQAGVEVVDGPATLDAIARHLPGCQALHLVSHGALHRDKPQGEAAGALFLEQPGGAVDLVKDAEIVEKLAGAAPLPHLVFLAACESAKRPAGAENAFVGIGPKLVRAGIPAVVAMQDLLSMATARQLTTDFYTHLLDHGVVDLALNQARNLLWREAQAGWSAPVLFLRLRHGRLLEQPAGEAQAQPAPTYSATLSGSGAIAQDHSVAAGAGGIAIGRIGHP